MPHLIELVFGARYLPATDAARIILVAAAVQLAVGWAKSFPVYDRATRPAPADRRDRDGRGAAARPRARPALGRHRSGGRATRGSIVVRAVLGVSLRADPPRAGRPCARPGPPSRLSGVPSVDDWPGEERRRPRLSTPQWAVRAPLAAWLEQQAQEAGTGYRVLDVGCGPKPYYPFFAERAGEYVGVDVVPQPAAELRRTGRGAAGRGRLVRPRPLHPGARALRRPCASGRRAAPRDRPRRPRARVDARRPGLPPVAAGLLALDVRRPRASLRRERRLGVGRGDRRVPGRPPAWRCCSGSTRRSRCAARLLARGPVWLLNRTAAALDARFASLREPRPGSLTANFHVVATVGR